MEEVRGPAGAGHLGPEDERGSCLGLEAPVRPGGEKSVSSHG